MIETKKIITSETEEEFIKTVISLVKKNSMTVSNVLEATEKIINYMNDNAVIQKEIDEKTPISSEISRNDIDIGPHPEQSDTSGHFPIQ
ncbi:hypothetical protein [Extibacter muris]|uniref:Uncharacterized protein n=1 Tax=Extibacter muris TaxID=1796622 RepID=A0A4R4FEH4_9FIRM|nr:hypothetical protein [Extibacter muris]MCU0079303.1 hypothetical protein [Extibacter muris]TDA21967.1 hypothetical protein E1963_09420 [Extibacter muris]